MTEAMNWTVKVGIKILGKTDTMRLSMMSDYQKHIPDRHLLFTPSIVNVCLLQVCVLTTGYISVQMVGVFMTAMFVMASFIVKMAVMKVIVVSV